MGEKKILIKDIKTYDPAKVPDEVLLDDFRLITAKYSTMKDGGKTEFETIDDVVKMGTRIIQEVVKRGTITFHPDRMKPNALELFRKSLLDITKRGLYLVPPHAEMIHRGKKAAIVKSRKFAVEGFVYLCSGDLCYGIIRLWKPQRLSLTQFANKKDEHRVSEEERRTWWPGKGWLYLYQIREYAPFEKPKKFRLPKGVQTFISDVEFLKREKVHARRLRFSYEETNPTALSNADLIRAHAWVHARWESGERGEPAINFHVLVVKEMRRRGLEHRPWTDLDEKTLPFIEMEEAIDGNFVYYDEVTKIWPHGFELKKPLLSLIGSVPVQGFGHDIDLHVNWNPEDTDFLRVLGFRLRSFMPEHLKDRLHLVPDQDGPFTSFIPIANLRIEMLPLGERILQTMALEDKDLQRVTSEAAEKEAKQSIKEDKIEHFRYFRHLKGIAGYRENEVYNIDGLLEILKEKDYPYIVDQKYDGARVKIDKKGDRVEITSEDGGVWTDRFPTFVAEMKAMEDDVVLDAEITGIDPKTGAHVGRSDVAGYAHAKTPPDDKPFMANVFTILLLNQKDAHKETELDRKNILDTLAKESFKKDGRIRAIAWRLAKNEKEMKAAVEHFSDLKYSEGAMIKASQAAYPLTGRSAKWIKFKVEADGDFEVVDVHKVKGANAWNYLTVIRDEEGKAYPSGRTYNTTIGRVKGKEPLKKGDIIRVAFVNVNRYTDPKTGEVWYNFWAPRPIEWREDLLKPDTPTRINSLVKETRGEVEEKPYPTRYKKILGEMQRLQLQREYPKYSFVMQHHWRGKSCHLDFRRKVNVHLEGETILDQPAGVVKEPVETMDEAARQEKRIDWKFDPKMDPTKHVLVTGKAKQPLVWLGVEGIVEKGEIGATKEFVGVFYVSDRGSYMPGVEKAYFKEFFLYGNKRFKNGIRMVERLIETQARRDAEEEDEGRPPTGGPLVWETWIAKEDRPYLLTLRGRRRRDYVPAQGVSALNERWEKLIKQEFRWWKKKGLSRKEALDMMDRAFNDLVARGILPHRPIPVGGEKQKQARRKFALQRRWWKGQEVVRGMPVDFFDLRIDMGVPDYLLTFTFPKDPTIAESQATVFEKWKEKTPDGRPFKNWLIFEGEIPPLHKLNPNKKLPATVKILDRGEVDVIERSQDFISFRFMGKILKGIWIARREAPDAPVWVFERGELPKATK